MQGDRYVFDDRWVVPVAAGPLLVALADVASYPLWWPEVRSAQLLDPAGPVFRVACRARLPYWLRFDLALDDRRMSEGVLEGAMQGDLDGEMRCSVEDEIGSGPERSTVVRYYQDVRLMRPWLQRMAPVARPLFRYNHELMMASGRRGLGARLGGPNGRGIEGTIEGTEGEGPRHRPFRRHVAGPT